MVKVIVLWIATMFLRKVVALVFIDIWQQVETMPLQAVQWQPQEELCTSTKIPNRLAK